MLIFVYKVIHVSIFFLFVHLFADKIADEPPCSCDQNPPTRVTYNYTSQLLRIGLNESLSETSIIEMSLCYSGTVGNYLNQSCSAFDVDLSPESYSHLVLIAFPPVCNACDPVLDYTLYIGIDFNVNGEKFLKVQHGIVNFSNYIYVCVLSNGKLLLVSVLARAVGGAYVTSLLCYEPHCFPLKSHVYLITPSQNVFLPDCLPLANAL